MVSLGHPTIFFIKQGFCFTHHLPAQGLSNMIKVFIFKSTLLLVVWKLYEGNCNQDHGSLSGIYFTNRQWQNCKKAVSTQSLATANNVHKLEKPAIIRKTLCQIQIFEYDHIQYPAWALFYLFLFFCSQIPEILRNYAYL